MATPSPTMRRVTVALRPLQQLLQSEGFTFEPRQRATPTNRRPAVATFRRHETHWSRVLSLFADKANSKERGEFTIGVAIYAEEVQHLLGRPVDPDVDRRRPTYSVPLPMLYPPQEDHWWRVDGRTDLEALGIEWAALYDNAARRWFDKVCQPEGLQQELRGLVDERWGYAPLATRNEPLLWPAVEVWCGDLEMARNALRMMQADLRFDHVDIEGFRRRHGL